MDRRLLLDAELRELLQQTLGYVHIYYQPPENARMQFDAIVYKQLSMHVNYADNRSYGLRDSYQIEVISKDPDSPLPRAVQEKFSLCAPGKKFVSDNLYHFPFTIYY